MNAVGSDAGGFTRRRADPTGRVAHGTGSILTLTSAFNNHPDRDPRDREAEARFHACRDA